MLRRSISCRRPSRSKVPPQRLHALYEVLKLFAAFPSSHRPARGPTPVASNCQKGFERTGARKKARHGAASNGSACRGGRMDLGPRPRKPRLGARANRRGLLSCRLSLTRRLRPISRLFPRPSIRRQEHNLSNRQAAARARRAKPGAKRRQGGAQRPPRQGGLRVGVGGRCNQT